VNDGVLLVRDDGVIVLDAGIPWPNSLAALVEHAVAKLGDADDERWWPTRKAMELEHEQQ
jgi:hypothetical protein